MASRRSNVLRATPKPDIAPRFRLRRLKVENFRALETFDYRFPDAEIPGEPDVFVLGSRNGMGKTSILEAISLAIMGAELSEAFKFAWRRAMRDYGPDQSALNYGDYFVRAGAERASIEADFEARDGDSARSLIVIDKDLKILKQESDGFPRDKFRDRRDPDYYSMALTTLVGANAEPLLLERLVYLHSYRKVVEGMPDFGSFIASERAGREFAWRNRGHANFSAFKVSILAALIGQNDLFESSEAGYAPPDETVRLLNSLLEKFAKGKVSKLKPIHGNTIDIRISPIDGGESFSIDGLSSGQKEIVSTLFMIWKQTYRRPSIVLIDEPELHLNAEWHKVFVEELHRVAPRNQYILATHSELVAESVAGYRRAIMRSANKKS